MFGKPQISSSRPTTFLEMIDRSLRLYRANFVPFFAVAAITQTPIALLNLAIATQQQQILGSLGITPGGAGFSPEQAQAVAQQLIGPLAGSLFASLVITVFSVFVQMIVLFAPISYVVSETFQNRLAGMADGFSAVGKRIGPLFGAITVYMAALIVFSVVLTFLLFLCGLGLGLIVYGALAGGAFLVPVFMLEQISVQRGLSRTWSLGKTRIWPIIGVTAITFLISFLADLLIAVLLSGLADRSPVMTSTDTIITVVDVVVSSLVAPVVPIAFTLLYYDARVRVEGLDIALRAAPNLTPADHALAAGQSGGQSGQTQTTQTRFIASEDLLNIALVCMGTFVLVLIVGAIVFLSGGGAAALR